MRIAGEPDDAQAIVRGGLRRGLVRGRAPPSGPATPRTLHWLLVDHPHPRHRSRTRTRCAAGGGDNLGRPGRRSATTFRPAPRRATSRRSTCPTRLGAKSSTSRVLKTCRVCARRIRELPPLERLAIELAYFEGLTISQLAMRLEQAPEAANARIRTGLRRLAGSVGASRMSEPRRDMPPTPELTGLYALGALNARERAAFDAHLEVHREAVDEVLLLLPVARRLAWTVPPHEPPAGLRERVMETVTGGPPAAESDSPERAAASAGAAEGEWTPTNRRRPRGRSGVARRDSARRGADTTHAADRPCRGGNTCRHADSHSRHVDQGQALGVAGARRRQPRRRRRPSAWWRLASAPWPPHCRRTSTRPIRRHG